MPKPANRGAPMRRALTLCLLLGGPPVSAQTIHALPDQTYPPVQPRHQPCRV